MSSALIPRLFSPILRSSRTISPSVLRPYPRLPRTQQPAARRFAHTIPKPRSPAAAATESTSTSSSPTKKRILLEPHYKLTFTCVPCSGRSTHTISKQGYHKGSVLITCPSCRNRHIISDHLNIFGNRKITVEDLMREKGQLVKRGTLGVDGDVEFWEDGTATEREDDTAGNGFDSTEVKNEVAALSEEEDATRSREARDPSSQSAEPTNRTPTPLSNPGGRPSLDSTQHSHHVPSTRRQYYTGNTHNLDSDGSKPSPFGRPSLSGLPTNPLGSRGAVIEKLDSEDPLRRMLVKKRSAARRISKEEMLEQVKKLAAARPGADLNLGPQTKRALEETNGRLIDDRSDDFHDAMKYGNSTAGPRQFSNGSNEIRPRHRVANDEESFRGVRYFKAKEARKPPSFRLVLQEPTYRGVRLYAFGTVDERPRYVRTGPGHLIKQRRPTEREEEEIPKPDRSVTLHDRVEQNAADEGSFGSPLATSETTYLAWEEHLSRTRQSAKLRSIRERLAAKRSKMTNTFVRDDD